MERQILARATVVLIALSLLWSLAPQAQGRPQPTGIRGGGRIVYHGGDFMVKRAPAAFDSCPSGYVCLWDGANYSGSLFAFNNCCAWINLSDYGFNNAASSWRNRMSVDAQLAMGADGNGSRLCLNNNSSDGNMGTTWNDAASSERIRDAGTFC